MKIHVISESGYKEALFGLGLSYGLTSQYHTVNDMDVDTFNKLEHIAFRLAKKDGGHNKFLESIVVWIDITAPRYFHSQLDTYRVGTTKQSESTMHTIMARRLTQSDFQTPIDNKILDILNKYIDNKNFTDVKNILPEGFLQRRIICTNYKVLRNMVIQRGGHRLEEWKYFCSELNNQLKHSGYIV